MRQEIAQQTAYAGARDKFVALGLTAAEKKIISDIARIDQELEAPILEAIAGAIEQAMAFDSGTVSRIFGQQINPLNQQALQEINHLVEIQVRASNAFLASSIAGDRELVLFLTVLGGLGVAIGALCAWIITRSITWPLQQAVAQGVATGDLTHASTTAVWTRSASYSMPCDRCMPSWWCRRQQRPSACRSRLYGCCKHFLDSRYYQRQANHNQHQTRDATHGLMAQWWWIFFAGQCSQGHDR